jgi:predicted  nucleic acid-binding Zn-ribbon protein
LGTSCSNSANDEAAEKLKEENLELQRQLNERDEAINAIFADFNDIEDKLADIRKKEGIIKASGNPETDLDVKARIESEIASINELMESNKSTIASLRKKIKDGNFKISEFEKTINRLNKLIEEKDAEIDLLKKELVALNFTIDELNQTLSRVKQENEDKSKTIDAKTSELNSAYYAFGTRKELTEKGVLTKDGGFIGIGGNNKLKDDFNEDYFTKIDIRETKSITLMAKKAKVVTSHPSDSYNIEGNKTADKLIITNSEKFWKTSKYLVIVID